MLIVANYKSRWSADIERQDHLHRPGHARCCWCHNRFGILTEKLYLNLMLLIRLTPRDSYHDSDADGNSVRGVNTCRNLHDINAATRNIEQIVHCLGVIAEDRVNLHIISSRIRIRAYVSAQLRTGRHHWEAIGENSPPPEEIPATLHCDRMPAAVALVGAYSRPGRYLAASSVAPSLAAHLESAVEG